MITGLLFAPLLFVNAYASVLSGPQPRAVTTSCNRDDCYRAVFGTQLNSRIAQASADCSSYMRRTVSQCSVTVTSTTTISVPVTTSTVLTSTLATSILTVTTPSPIVTVTSIVVQTAAAKRDVLINVHKRAVTVCAVTTGPTAVPTYASTCSGAARWSSVCACAGITAKTTTVSVQTSTVMVTVQLPYTVTETTTSTLVATTSTLLAIPFTSTLVQTSTMPALRAAPTDCATLSGAANPYVAANGKQFQILCNSDYYHSATLGYVPAFDLKACIDLCSTTVGCNFVNWSKPPYNLCMLLTAQMGYYSTNWPMSDSVALLPPLEPYTVLPPPDEDY